MKRSITFLLIVLISMGTTVLASEWTDAEKEVLSDMEKSYETWVKKDMEGFLNYIHDDYCGWHYESAVPQKKSNFVNTVNYYFPKFEVIFYELTPLEVQIFDDVAFVHYYFYFLAKDEEGKEQSSQSRYTDILMKVDGKWMLISDHGGDIEVK